MTLLAPEPLHSFGRFAAPPMSLSAMLVPAVAVVSAEGQLTLEGLAHLVSLVRQHLAHPALDDPTLLDLVHDVLDDLGRSGRRALTDLAAEIMLPHEREQALFLAAAAALSVDPYLSRADEVRVELAWRMDTDADLLAEMLQIDDEISAMIIEQALALAQGRRI